MGDINRVVMVARLTRDAELKYTAGGTPVANFAVANNQTKKVNGEWTDRGILQQDRREQDGQKRNRVKINVRQLCLHPRGNNSDNGGYSESGPVSGPTPGEKRTTSLFSHS